MQSSARLHAIHKRGIQQKEYVQVPEEKTQAHVCKFDKMLPEQVVQLIKMLFLKSSNCTKNTHLDLKHHAVRMHTQIKVKSAKLHKNSRGFLCNSDN